MAEYCKLTGVEIPEGGLDANAFPLKKMCLNCQSCIEHEDGTFACENAAVMESGRQKIMETLPEGFEIEELKLKPMKLKNPLKKCGHYGADLLLIHSEVDKYFV